MGKLQLKRYTLADWTTSNPVLTEGEFVLELDTNKIKIGDGVSNYLDLDYFASGGSSLTFENGLTESSGIVSLGGTLTNNTTIDTDSYEFNIINGGAIYLQSDGDGITIEDSNGGGINIYDTNQGTITLQSDNDITVISQISDGSRAAMEVYCETDFVNSQLFSRNTNDSRRAYIESTIENDNDIEYNIGIKVNLNHSGLVFTNGSNIFRDAINTKGLEYLADYSINFTDRSLVDKGYVVQAIYEAGTAGGGITSVAWGDLTGTLSDQADLQSALDAKQNSLGFTVEDVANKSTSTSLGTSDTLYPTQNAVKTYVDTGLSGKQASLGFTAEDVANKSTSTSLGSSDTLYPSQNAVKTYVDTGLATKQASLGFTAENVANKDTSTSLGSSNTAYPSQLAVKTYVDTADATKANKNPSIVSITTTTTLDASHDGKILECSGTFTLTLPNSMATAMQVAIINIGSGTITLAASTSLVTEGSKTKLATQHTAASAYHAGSNVWRAFGRLTT